MLVDREVIECFISWGELKVLEALNQDELAPLMERVTHGDQKALSDLYDATRSRVFSLALFMVRETDLAEDVVVDVYAQIWRNAASYDESKGGVLNWVLMMTRSRALDVIRVRGRIYARETGLDDAETLCHPAEKGPEQISLAADRAQKIRRALGTLPLEQRELILAGFFCGLSHAELADQFRLPLGTVKSRMRLGLTSLRRRLEGVVS